MPLNFCCSYCYHYDSEYECLKSRIEREITPNKIISSLESKIKLISTSIRGMQLKVVIEQEGKQIPIYIDLKKHLKST